MIKMFVKLKYKYDCAASRETFKLVVKTFKVYQICFRNLFIKIVHICSHTSYFSSLVHCHIIEACKKVKVRKSVTK